jgi:RNA polymerase sigma-70 factor (ECF subfamily)
MNELEAIQRLKAGDVSGLDVLVRAHQVRAMRAAYLIVRDVPLAEDIVQAAFLRAFDNIRQFDETRPFAPWFLRIVVNDAVKAATRTRRNVSMDAEVQGERVFDELLATLNADPLDAAAQAEERARVWEALGRLEPRQRAAVVAHYFLGFSEAEIAQEQASPLGTIKWRIHEAKVRLRELLGTEERTNKDSNSKQTGLYYLEETNR